MLQNRKRLVLLSAIVLILGGSGAFVWYYFFRIDNSPVVPQPSTIAVGKDTTFINKPLDKFGYVDYAEAIDQRYRNGVTVENNAAVPFWQAFGPSDIPPKLRTEFFKRLGIPELPERGDYIRDANSEKWTNILGKIAEKPWKSDDHPWMAQWLKDHEQSIQLLVNATNRSHFYSPMLSPTRLQGRQPALNLLMPACQNARIAARVFLVRAMLHQGEGRIEMARSDVFAGHRLARLVNQNSFVIGGLVAIAVDAVTWTAHFKLIQSNKLTKGQLARARADLRSLTDVAGCVNRLDTGDRLIILDCATLLARNRWDAFEEFNDGRIGRTAFERKAERKLCTLADWDTILRAINRHFDRAVAIGRIKNRDDRNQALEKLIEQIHKMRSRSRGLPELSEEAVTKWFADWLVADLCPAFGNVWHAEDRNRLRMRMGRVAYALASYWLETGHYPELLDQLAPKYLKSVPNDPHTGRALYYQKQHQGYRLGSLGQDGWSEPEGSPQSTDDFIITATGK